MLLVIVIKRFIKMRLLIILLILVILNFLELFGNTRNIIPNRRITTDMAKINRILDWYAASHVGRNAWLVTRDSFKVFFNTSKAPFLKSSFSSSLICLYNSIRLDNFACMSPGSSPFSIASKIFLSILNETPRTRETFWKFVHVHTSLGQKSDWLNKND